MKLNRILISTFVILLLTQIAFASTVTRTIENNKNFTYVGSTGTGTENIEVTLTGTPSGDFSFAWGVNETLPENMNVVLITDNANVIKKDARNWSFASINGNILKYNITANSTAISTAIAGFYIITGYFITSENTNVMTTITPDISIRITPLSNTNIITMYDTNGIPGIQREEVIGAVVDYFLNIISMSDVLTVVRAYLGL